MNGRQDFSESPPYCQAHPDIRTTIRGDPIALQWIFGKLLVPLPARGTCRTVTCSPDPSSTAVRGQVGIHAPSPASRMILASEAKYPARFIKIGGACCVILFHWGIRPDVDPERRSDAALLNSASPDGTNRTAIRSNRPDRFSPQHTLFMRTDFYPARLNPDSAKWRTFGRHGGKI